MSEIHDETVDRPLHGIRVIDAVNGQLQMVGRILADLGAEVLRVEPTAGSPARRAGVCEGARSLTFETRNAGKRSVVVDLETGRGREHFLELAASADLVIRDGSAGSWSDHGLAATRLREGNPRLVVLELSDFGSTGERASWTATPDVHAALSTVLSRSGLPNVTEPLLPPEFLMYESAAVQAVWTALLELAHVRATGQGDTADFSVQEALIQILDPAFGVGGSARAGVPLSELPRGRPDARYLYPIFPAVNGMIRICVLSPRQWHGMFDWLGRPAEFDDPKYDNIVTRFAAAGTLYPAIEKSITTLTVAAAVEQGQQHGVPTAALAGAGEVLAEPAFRENGSFVETTVDGVPLVAHSGWFEIDDVRLGAQGPAPLAGDAAISLAHRGVAPLRGARPGRRPFEGLRVLDLGVIVVGAELGRLFADYGADVIKVESSAFPDGVRQSPDGEAITESTSWGMRNKRSIGLNLRTEDGQRVFADLVRRSDVVLTNFKPGTLASLGFGMDTLRTLNPGIILSESSAFGNHGSWSRRLGYGPLVRASAGLSALWSYPDEADGTSDAITIFPDHVVARLNAAAIVALLLRRDRTGVGGRVSTAQVDAIFGAMADLLLAESLAPGSGPRAEGNDRSGDAFRGIFPAAGDDEWIVVDAYGDSLFAAVAHAIGRPDIAADPGLASPALRWERRHELRAVLSEWTQTLDPREASVLLQTAGVPAGAMLRIDDLRADPHLRGRQVFGELIQPQFDHPLIANLGEARTQTLAPPLTNPAPLMAEQTRVVLRDVLGMAEQDIQRLIDTGALEENPAVSYSDEERTTVTSIEGQASIDLPPQEITVAGDGAVRAEQRGHVLLVTLNRPDARNAVNMAVMLGVGEALDYAETAADVWCVIITGAGNRSFCAGADIKAVAAGQFSGDDPRLRDWGFAGYVQHHISKPTIAAVNGFAFGGGTEITLASDLAVAADTAAFGLPEVKRGIVARAGGAFRLPRQIPDKIAMEAMLTGKPLTAERALELGLVNRVVPLTELLPAAFALADEILANAPLAVQVTKRIAKGITDGAVPAEEEDWQRSAIEGERLMTTRDALEGMRAFREKRAPRWEGM